MLDKRAREILDFEKLWWKFAGMKEESIRQNWGLSSTRYYQVLNALLDDPEAMIYSPMVVKRLRRLREVRQQKRRLR